MDKRTKLQRRLLRWFNVHKRDLPWRKTKDPYHILVSEIMLQQTQVDRVIPVYRAFLRRFPNIRTLARAAQRSVLLAWSGLGYNRRARNLHQLAKRVVADSNGVLPRTQPELQNLPGIGPYTAAAVACFAFGAPVALVDVNVRRVFGRIAAGVHGPATLTNAKVWALAAAHVPKQSVAWNSALMDFGATVCTARLPKCQQCPLQQICAAYPKILQEKIPKKKIAKPFVGSNRYWRGKIVHVLRLAPGQRMPWQKFAQQLQQSGLSEKRLRTLLQNLLSERLVQQKGHIVRL